MGTSVRRTRDHRILIRNSIRYEAGIRSGAAQRRAIRSLHRESFRARFPALCDVDFEYTWGGVMGVSLNNVQFFGRVAQGVFASAGYNGVGLALGTASGQLLADLAAGSESPLLRDVQALPGPAWLPPQPFLGVGIRLALAHLQRRAGGEL
jgi:glycine/D-amino acid oxidase-like deaminating enzyme